MEEINDNEDQQQKQQAAAGTATTASEQTTVESAPVVGLNEGGDSSAAEESSPDTAKRTGNDKSGSGSISLQLSGTKEKSESSADQSTTAVTNVPASNASETSAAAAEAEEVKAEDDAPSGGISDLAKAIDQIDSHEATHKAETDTLKVKGKAPESPASGDGSAQAQDSSAAGTGGAAAAAAAVPATTIIDSRDRSSSIDVQIQEPVVNFTDKIVKFCLKGIDRYGQFEVYRLEKDFLVLRRALFQRWPGFYIPPVPDKNFSSLDTESLEARKLMLETFVNKVSGSEPLWYSEEMRHFLDQNVTNIEKSLGHLDRQPPEDVINKYSQGLQQLSGLEITVQLIMKINDFQVFLKRIGNMLSNYKQMAENMEKRRKAYLETYVTFLRLLMPEYEKGSVREYLVKGGAGAAPAASQDASGGDQASLAGHVFLNEAVLAQVQDLQQNLQQYDTRFQHLKKMLRAQEAEVRAFLEALDTKDFYNAQKEKADKRHQQLQLELQGYMAGKKSIKDVLSGSKADGQIEKVQREIAVVHKELQSLQLIYDMIIVIMGYIEIDQFKKSKVSQYYRTVAEFGRAELELSKAQAQLWQRVLDLEAVSAARDTQVQ